MSSVDPALADEAQRFADEIADLLARTVSADPPIRALARNDRVVVAPFDDRGEKVNLALSVAGEHRLELHLPVGGRRLRPSLEDVIDFAIRDLAVDAQPDAAGRIAEGRTRWRRVQVKALIRDVIKDDPASAPGELHQVINGAVDDVSGERGA